MESLVLKTNKLLSTKNLRINQCRKIFLRSSIIQYKLENMVVTKKVHSHNLASTLLLKVATMNYNVQDLKAVKYNSKR